MRILLPLEPLEVRRQTKIKELVNDFPKDLSGMYKYQVGLMGGKIHKINYSEMILC